jgi:uracil-DNA glycosylase
MPPANQADGGYKFLSKYFNNCKKYLFQEIEVFKPDMVITLGEPSHIFFMSLFDKTGKDYKMKNDFTGKFEQMTSPNGREFFYSPCLHIQTFRVAETYGNAVKSFKQGLKEILAENNGFPPARE